MGNINKRYWGRSTKVAPKRQSFKRYAEGAVEWAKNNRKAACTLCGTETECTCAEIVENDIVASFTCACGHTTTQIAKESELLRTYNV